MQILIKIFSTKSMYVLTYMRNKKGFVVNNV